MFRFVPVLAQSGWGGDSVYGGAGGPSDTGNHAADGMIAVQVHGGNKIWNEGGRCRFRNIAICELHG